MTRTKREVCDECVWALRDLVAAEWMVTHDWGGDRESVLEKARVALKKHPASSPRKRRDLLNEPHDAAHPSKRRRKR